MSSKQLDNSTLEQKVALRRVMLRDVEAPIVCEAFAGKGEIWKQCYSALPFGLAIEKDEEKAAVVALQRPTWAVYRADAVAALEAGLGALWPVNVLDLDPYGEPWPALRAFLESDRPRPDVLHVVVNDGLRHNVRLGTAWSVESLKPAVHKFGADLWDRYLEVCRWLAETIAGDAGYRVARWHGYYCGVNQAMTHYLMRLERVASESSV